MRAARPERLPGGAAGASLALHLGAGLWLALGATPGGPPGREAVREVPVAFAMLSAGEAEPPPGLPELEEPALAEAAPDAEQPPAEPIAEPPPLAEAPPEPAPPPIAAPAEPIPEAPALAEAPPQPPPPAAEPIPEEPPLAEPPPPVRSEAPRPPTPPAAAPRRPPPRPAQAMGRGVPREATTLAGPAAAAIPVAAAAPNPGPPPLITQARYRHPPTPPAYPPRAIALRMAGTALIRALVGPDGQTREVRLHRSSGFGELDNAALAAVRGWAFTAATEGGRPIEAWVEVPVRFRLDD